VDQASSQDSDEAPEYAFAGVEPMPVAIQALTLELFSGQVAKRDAIAENVRKTHLERGGTDSNAADYPRSVKKALAGLEARELATNPGYATWRIAGNGSAPAAPSAPEVSIDQNVGDTNIVASADLEFGAGRSAIYVYFYDAYRDSALAVGSSRWPCKIGRTDRDPLNRVLSQAATALPEYPHVGLIFRNDEPGTRETAIHAVLTLRGLAVDDAPGTEWFVTSPDEILELMSWINPSAIPRESS
jgi:hypothetical protein